MQAKVENDEKKKKTTSIQTPKAKDFVRLSCYDKVVSLAWHFGHNLDLSLMKILGLFLAGSDTCQ